MLLGEEEGLHTCDLGARRGLGVGGWNDSQITRLLEELPGSTHPHLFAFSWQKTNYPSTP